jgi:1,3-beta-glucanosyltransferase GAS1
LTEADPLIDTDQCTRDAALMKTLGTNAIRVYHVDSTGDHSGCMAAFAAAGIYLFVDLDTFTTQIDPVRLMYSGSYVQRLIFLIVDWH